MLGNLRRILKSEYYILYLHIYESSQNMWIINYDKYICLNKVRVHAIFIF